jgi:hypothetical protein
MFFASTKNACLEHKAVHKKIMPFFEALKPKLLAKKQIVLCSEVIRKLQERVRLILIYN